jgi:orotate phosphoribosyltransferase
VQDLRHDKTAWLDGDADTAGANDIVSKYYKTAAFAGIPKDALLVAMPSTSGRNILPFALANRISKDFGQAIEQRPVGTATAKGEAKNKRTFFDKEADPVAFVPVAKVIADLQGKRVFITEDVHNTGESWIAFARMLMDNGVQVLGVATLVSTEQRITSPRDIERLSEKIAAATGKGIDEVLPAMHSLFDGTFKQLFNKAEAEVSRSNTRRNAENSAKLFDIASSGRRAGAYSNPLQSGDGSGGEVLGGDGLNQGTFGFSIGSFHESLLDRIGEDELRLEQPHAKYEDKRQLLLDFAASIVGPEVGHEESQEPSSAAGDTASRGDAGRLGSIQILGQRLANNLATDLQVKFLGETIRNSDDIAAKAMALRNPLFETFYLLAMKPRTKRHKGGAGFQVVNAMAVTSRVPCCARVFDGQKTTEQGYDDHAEFLKSSGAKHYVMIHNHPSGDPTPSGMDVRMTVNHALKMQDRGFVMMDHVVINHETFSTIDGVGTVNPRQKLTSPTGSADFTSLPSWTLRDVDAADPSQIVAAARNLLSAGGS